jgi:hypothetical protein
VFNQSSRLSQNPNQCYNRVDFTYFQTIVTIPGNITVNDCVVAFDAADDGVRAYVFNSANPNGAYVPNSEITEFRRSATANIASLLRSGEDNRIVLVQGDDCPVGNTLTNARISINGTTVNNISATGLNFDGTDDYVLGNLNTTISGGLTFQTWFKTTKNSGQIAKLYGATTDQGFDLYINTNGTIGLNAYLGGWINANSTGNINVIDGNWHQATVSISGTTASVYIDGVFQTSVNGPGTFNQTQAILCIGRHFYAGAPSSFRGTLDDVRLWTVGLCSANITNNYNCQLSGSQPGLVAYYKLNQGIIDANNSTENVAVDASGNGLNLPLNNFTLSGSSSNWVAGTVTGTCAPYLAPSVSITTSGNTTFCSGGSVVLTANPVNASNPSYQWYKDGVAINLATANTYSASTTGRYTVVVNPTGCSATSSPVTLTVNALPAVTLSSNGSNKCEGETFNFSVNPAGLTYLWTGPNGFTSTSQANSVISSSVTAGMYRVDVTDANGCRGSGADVLINKAKPAATITANGATAICPGGSVTLNANTGSGFTYQWLRNGVVIGSATNSSYTASGAGNYSVIVTSNGCSSTSPDVSVNFSDTQIPVVLTRNITITLDNSGTATITASQVNNNSTDNCGIESMTVYPNTFSCINAGANTVTLTVRDVNGNVNTATAIVTVQLPSCSAPISLNNWTREGAAANGNWTVAADGLSVYQSINGNPTFFVSPNNYYNTTIEGSFKVETASDDDFVGFVMGYNSPTSTGLNNYNFILFDWKKGTQAASSGCGTSQKGYALTRVQGLASTTAILDAMVWCKNSPNTTMLASNLGANAPAWVTNTEYNFKVEYGATNIKIWINGDLIFDVNGSFPNGRFGFYNYSQSDVRYRSFNQPFSVVVNSQNATCPGSTNGSATAQPSGAEGPYTYSWTGPNGFTATTQSINNLSAGTYNVTVKAGNCCTATQTVVITDKDIIRPVLTPASNQTINLDASCAAIIPDVTGTATDNCGVVTITQNPAAGVAIASSHNATINVIVTATDGAGLTDTRIVALTVKDVTPPVINCPQNMSVVATGAAGAVVNYTAPVGTDNCAGTTTTRIAGLASGSTFPLGTSTVTYEVEDAAGLKSQCSFTVTVTGVQPVISCPGNIVVNNVPGQCRANVGFTASETTGVPASTITYSHQPGSTFPVGTTTVTATATNAIGSSSCTFTVTVIDNEVPVVKTKPITVYLNAQGTVSINPADVDNGSTDNCGINNMTVSKTSFDCSNLGVNTVTLTVKDNSTIASGVEVDQQNTAANSTPAGFSYMVQTFTPASNVLLTGIETKISYNHVSGSQPYMEIREGAGITGTLLSSQVITIPAPTGGYPEASPLVQFNLPSPITLSGGQVYSLIFRHNGNFVSFNVQINNGTNPYSGGQVMNVNGSPGNYAVNSGNPFNTWDIYFKTLVQGTGNTSTGTAIVTVADNIAPVLSCPSGITTTAAAGQCATAVNVIAPTATDNCSATVTGVRGDNQPLNATFPIGITTITWRATDPAGNVSNTCTQTITVQAPEINVTGNGITISNGDNTAELADFTNWQAAAGNSSTKTFVIQNTGNSTLNISGVSITGADASSFTVTSNAASSVAAGGSTSFTVRLSAPSRGVKNAVITISNSDCDEANYSFAVKGDVFTTFDVTCFNYVDDLTASAAGTSNGIGWSIAQSGLHRPATVTNNSYAANATLIPSLQQSDNLHLGYTPIAVQFDRMVSYVLIYAREFDGQGLNFGITPVLVSGSANIIGNSFYPQSGGCVIRLDNVNADKLVSQVVNNNVNGVDFAVIPFAADPGLPVATVPEINVKGNNTSIVDGDNTPTTSDNTHYGGTLPGVAVSKTYTIENTGTGALTISTINISGTNAAEFSVSGISLPVTVAAGGSETFTVTFNSTVLGNRNAVININNNDCDETLYDFAVTAQITCAPASFTACPSNLNVNTIAGSCSSPVSYTVATNGQPAATLSYSFGGATTGSGNGTGSGSTFNVGVTTVTVRAVNPCSNVTCTFTVTVNDTEAPVFSGVPATNTTVNCDAVPAPANVTASDNCATSLPVTYFQVPSVSVNTLHHWTGDGNMNDVGGTANGSAAGTISYTQGVVGTGAFNFNGSNHINIGTAGSISGTGDFAISAWIKTSATSPGVIIQQRDGGIDGQYILKVGSNHNNSIVQQGKVYFLVYGSGSTVTDLFSTISVNDGKWHQVTAERRGTNVAIYIDGVLNVSATTSTLVNMNASIGTYIGKDVRDNSSNFNGLIDNIKVYTSSACPQAYERDRYWSVIDAAGNQSVATQTLHVVDVTAPVLSAAPANVTVECNAVPSAATLTATDNCDANPVINYKEVRTNGNCPFNYTLTRTWRATDACGNSSSRTQVITVVDNTPPMLVLPARNATVECNKNGSDMAALQVWLNNHAGASAVDNCGDVRWTNNFTGLSDGCGSSGSAMVTFTATDACGNSSTTIATFTIVDTQAPIITAPASNQTVVCDGNGNTAALQAWLTNNGGATATDACSGVSWTNDFAAGNWVVDCGGAKHITVVFTATDACGNSSETTATFRIKDETAPAVATAAGSLDITLECSDAAGIAAAIAMSPSPTDDCSRVTIHLVSDVTTSGCGTTYRRVRQWNFTDECGNTSATFTQTINTKDETAPQITCPASVTVNCQDDSSPAATGEATATDNCSTPVVSYNDVSTQSADINNRAHYNYTITRTWTAVDACNNVSTCVQTITVQDVTKPVITCPANATVNCQDDNTSASNGKATATDNCGPVAITETQTSTQSSDINSAAHYNYVITRTWRATDVTGNYTECVQTITVQDITKPVAVCKPVTITLVNGSASIVATDVNGGSTDNCSPLRYTVSKSSFNCSNIGANTVTLTVTDVSGNVSTCQATVNVVGEIPTCKITSVPTSNVYTGGNPTSLYLGYGAQSTELSLDVPASGAPYTFSWSGNGSLSSTTVQSPLFAPTTAGVYTFTVFITNKYGCTTSCTISICVTDIRVMNARTGTWDGKKVYVCHVPPGNPGNSNTLEISVNAVPSHIGAIGHGTDRLGKCEVPVCTAPVYARGGAPTETTSAVHASYIKAYPNPTTGVFALLLQNYSKGKVEVQVVDNYGKLVANQSVTVMNQSENVTIDVTKHASGTYHVRVISEDGVKTLRVVVAR